MKKYKVDFLGNKDICLEKKESTIEERVNNCNKLIELIASKDRCFFKRKDNGNIAYYRLQDNNKLLYFDHRTYEPVKNTSCSNTLKWKGSFTGGGTLQHFIMCMSIYIESGIPFFYWHSRCSNWGYYDESLEQIKAKGIELGIFTTTNRYMFWLHNEKQMELIPDYLAQHQEISIDKCITVLTKNEQEAPFWVGEFNFQYIGLKD